jgi:ABC-type nickel/cobalt efflux system permease component RcnA
MRSPRDTPAQPPIPRWLRFVMASDRAGSAWYIGLGFFFAPALAAVSPWPTLTTVLWIAIALAGLWLGLLGLAMATGLAVVLRSGAEIPEDYWRSIFDYSVSERPTRRCSRPASA